MTAHPANHRVHDITEYTTVQPQPITDYMTSQPANHRVHDSTADQSQTWQYSRPVTEYTTAQPTNHTLDSTANQSQSTRQYSRSQSQSVYNVQHRCQMELNTKNKKHQLNCEQKVKQQLLHKIM